MITDDGTRKHRMSNDFPKVSLAKRKLLLERVEAIAPVLRASGPKSEEQGALAAEPVPAARLAQRPDVHLGCRHVDDHRADQIQDRQHRPY